MAEEKGKKGNKLAGDTKLPRIPVYLMKELLSSSEENATKGLKKQNRLWGVRTKQNKRNQ